MEIGLREVLIVIGVAIIGIILLDGFRRVRRSHNNSLKVSWKLGDQIEGDEEGIYRAELPGRARKMGRTEPGISDDALDPIFSTTQPKQDSAEHNSTQHNPAEFEPAEDKIEQQDLFPPGEESPGNQSAAVTFESSLNSEAIEEIIVINIVAREAPFRGDMLLEALLSCGMRYGRMNIFHCYEKSNGKEVELFSMANITEPGFFDIDKMDDFETRGVCLFMSLPGPENVQLALDQLIEAGRKIASMLDGEMRDENHSVLTQQTIEHYRQRVSDFERRQLSSRVVS